MVALGSSHHYANFCEDLKGVSSNAFNLPSSPQARIFSELEELVRVETPERVLKEFKTLFFQQSHPSALKSFPVLKTLVRDNKQHEFLGVLKRCCYILCNRWVTNERWECMGELLKLFLEPSLSQNIGCSSLDRVRNWILSFAKSEDYQDLHRLVQHYARDLNPEQKTSHWSDRYIAYHWVSQSIDLSNPPEQRELASQVAQQMKDRFKYDLAMYTTRAQSAAYDRQMHPNPTQLGEDALRFIKLAIARTGDCGYEQLSRRLLEQTKNVTYDRFKERFKTYLLNGCKSWEELPGLKQNLIEKLDLVYPSKQNEVMNSALLLVTCNRAIEWLTTENKQDPSALFKMLVSWGNPITWAIALLKLVLLCPYSRLHLECCLANLLRYYKQLPEAECTFAIHCFEALKILLAIYSGDVEYSLVKIQPASSLSGSGVKAIDLHRVFLTLKSASPVPL